MFCLVTPWWRGTEYRQGGFVRLCGGKGTEKVSKETRCTIPVYWKPALQEIRGERS